MALRIDTKQGDRVFVSDKSAEEGSENDKNKVEMYLQRNVLYKVKHIKQQAFHCEIYLEAMPFMPFSSINFENFD